MFSTANTCLMKHAIIYASIREYGNIIVQIKYLFYFPLSNWREVKVKFSISISYYHPNHWNLKVHTPFNWSLISRCLLDSKLRVSFLLTLSIVFKRLLHSSQLSQPLNIQVNRWKNIQTTIVDNKLHWNRRKHL